MKSLLDGSQCLDLPLVEKILSQKGPKKAPKEVFWDPHGKDLGPLGTRMGAFWELTFWDFPIEWHLWEFYGKLLGPFWEHFWESYGRISQNFGMSQKKVHFWEGPKSIVLGLVWEDVGNIPKH
eukprot:jgi/Botrbrau1/11565/Bobra.60_1s0017.1